MSETEIVENAENVEPAMDEGNDDIAIERLPSAKPVSPVEHNGPGHRAPHSLALDSPEFKAKMQERWAKFNAAQGELPPEIKDNLAKPDEEPVKEVAEEKPVSTPVEKPAETAETSEGAVLPAAYRRSLKAYGMNDAEINSNFKAMGPAFLTFASNIHDRRNKEIQQWATAGQQRTAAQPTAAQSEGLLIPIDVTALKAKYGDEPLLDELVRPINKAIEQMNGTVSLIQETHRRSVVAQEEALGRHIANFFASDELKNYKDVYGSEKTATPEQQESRIKVLKMADALVAGASLQGHRLTFDDAMTMAHDSVTGPSKEAAARKEIAQTLQKRAASVTIKPQSKPKPGESRANSQKKLEEKVKARLAQVFG